MELYEIGAVTYCTNVTPGDSLFPEEAEYVASQVSELFLSRLAESPYAEDVGVIRAEYELGCVITTITIGASLAGLYKIIVDYEKFKSGLSQLAKDLNGVYVRVKQSLHRNGSTYIMRINLPDERVLEVTLKKAENQEIKPLSPTKSITSRSRK
ncbi:hypothetical protein SAMN05216404_101208 [Nitrosospira multiformis]|uniref:Uncharacterized protein n=1 Tax=Nitrosospira multiformis TaxID=1231 RepID=A0A1H8BD05_9PROT|nr:hypothetical protein [Nitrosospira multiformis]SEM80636.1 hypothetical protein SAMN05216404_101208 [Nitrosospira multiformis]